jgi:hypothetical protein
MESWRMADICRCINADDGMASGSLRRDWPGDLAACHGWPAGHRAATGCSSSARAGCGWIRCSSEHGYRYLENWALASNRTTLRWLQHLGFTIDTPEPMGRGCQLFCHFWREA